MKQITRQIRVGLMTILSMVLIVPQQSFALDTVISTPPLVDGPFMITAYSFSGHSLRYLQISNTDDGVASLNGWRVQTEWESGFWQTSDLAGLIAPNNKATLANEALLPTATFPFTQTDSASEPRLESISLVAPIGSGLLDSVVSVSIKDSGSPMTERDTSTVPETFYFMRNRSSSTGNFLSTFTASAKAPTAIESDPLYTPASKSPLQVVEVYPNAIDCSPANVSMLCYDYVKVINATLETISLGDFRIRTGTISQSSTSSNTAYPTGQLASGSHAVIPSSLSDSGSFVWVEDVYGRTPYSESVVDYPSSTGRDGMAWSYNAATGRWQWTKYPTPGDEPNSFGPGGIVNVCGGLRLSEIGANYSPQFIEIQNTTTKAIDISGCQLQTNRSQVASYVFPDDTELAAGSYAAISIDKTDLMLTRTTTGIVYILSSDGSTEVDARGYEDLDDNTTLALVGGKWEQTFAVTPGSANQYQAYPPCQAGYTRNELTGRCNIDPEPSVLAPCGPGQYRSPETNRCRSFATTTSTLTPCGPGEFRNPETNRCKKIASTTSTLQPCDEGYERNPETNRCRKVLAASTSVPSAAFPVEPIVDSAKAFAAWWALGGLTLLGLGYAGWEWRFEISRWLKRASMKNES